MWYSQFHQVVPALELVRLAEAGGGMVRTREIPEIYIGILVSDIIPTIP